MADNISLINELLIFFFKILKYENNNERVSSPLPSKTTTKINIVSQQNFIPDVTKTWGRDKLLVLIVLFG